MKNLINKKFGKWNIIKYSHLNPDKNRHLWKCKCDCGIEKIIREDTLLNGTSKSCGCVNRHKNENNRRWKGCGEISGTYWNKLISNAKRRNKCFTLTIEDVWNLYLKQNRKCALTNLDISFSKIIRDYDGRNASLDRIDSSKGYTIDNVQWVHKDINRMKQSFSKEEFVDLCQLVVNKNNFHS